MYNSLICDQPLTLFIYSGYFNHSKFNHLYYNPSLKSHHSSFRHQYDIIMTSIWYHPDINMISSWHHSDINMISSWHHSDICMTSEWPHCLGRLARAGMRSQYTSIPLRKTFSFSNSLWSCSSIGVLFMGENPNAGIPSWKENVSWYYVKQLHWKTRWNLDPVAINIAAEL